VIVVDQGRKVADAPMSKYQDAPDSLEKEFRRLTAGAGAAK
jgi:hypothetical protein